MEHDEEEPLRALWRAIDILRPDLPALVGEDWPALEAQLAGWIGQVRQDPSRARTVDDASHPAPASAATRAPTSGWWRPGRGDRAAGARHGAGRPPGGRVGPARGVAALEPAAPARVVRYTDIAFPRRVWVQTSRVSLVLRLTAAPSLHSEHVQPLSLQEGLPVRVQVQSDGFDLLGDAVQEIAVLPDRDSPPSVFDLHPRRAGHTQVTLDFFQDSRPLGTVSVDVEMTPYEVVEGPAAGLARALQVDAEAEPPDLVLHIAYEAPTQTLTFTLIRKGGIWWRQMSPRRPGGRSRRLCRAALRPPGHPRRGR